MIKLPTEYKSKVYLLYLITAGCVTVAYDDYSKRDKDWVFLGERELTFDLTDISIDEVTMKAVGQLREKKADIFAQASKDAMKVQDQIDKLTAIGHEPTPPSPVEDLVATPPNPDDTTF